MEIKQPPLALSMRRTRRPASAAALTLGLPTLLMGQPVMAEDEPIVLDTLQIEERTVDTNPYAEPGAPYKAKISGDKRRVKPLAETPATIDVLTQTQVKDSGKSDLRAILAAQPGITLGTGENGNAFGDRYVIRGHEARSDVFVDGLRDPGMTTRESFAVEQIEITKGPSATFAGRGSSGGAVNSVTKQASTEYDFSKLEAGLGTDNYQRYTLDANQRITDDLAVRANLLYADRDVPDREPASRERIGAALSVAYQVSDAFNIVADYYYLDAEDKPDLGTYIDRNSGRPVDDIPVYLQKQDFLESEVEVATLRLGYQFNDTVRLENATRYGTTDNGYVATGARGTTRDATDPIAPGAATISLSTHQGWQEVEYWVNQSNLYVDTTLAGMLHRFVFSVEYSDLSVLNGTYDVTNTGATNCLVPGRSGVSSAYCILDGAGNTVPDVDTLMGRQISKDDFDSDYNVETLSLAVMDTIEIADQWTLFLGLRVDQFDYKNDVVGRGATVPDTWAYDDTLWNGNVGLVYQITEQGNVYLNYSTATNINGGESDVGANCGYGGLCGALEIVEDSEPEKVQNIELGSKWNLFNEKLLFTAAVFRIEKDDVMESLRGFDYAANGFLNTGESRVEGVEISLAGNITEKLSILFGAATMNAEIRDSVDEENIGKTLANFADNSAYMQLRYQLTDKLDIGTVATYSSEVYVGQPDSAANEDLGVPSYSVYDLFASYAFSDQLSLSLNVNNITDKDYYLTAYRSGSFTYIGDARNAFVTLSYEF